MMNLENTKTLIELAYDDKSMRSGEDVIAAVEATIAELVRTNIPSVP